MAAGWVALRPEPAPGAVLSAARPAWTPERLPAVLAEASGTLALERAVDEVLAPVPSSCLVAFEGDRPVITRRGDEVLTPASTQKVLIGVAAVHRLGADYRFSTKVLAERPPREGVVDRLWLVGSGDPLLATPEFAAYLLTQDRSADREPTPLDRLAERLVEAGVRSVTSGISGDDSRYDRTRSVPTWKRSYITNNNVGPLGALVVDSGFTDFVPPLVRAPEPAVHAAGQLARLAGARGIDVGPTVVAGEAPEGAVPLAEVRSVPLARVVATVVGESDNTGAELLVRELGRVGARDGSTAAGLQVVADELAELGLPTSGLQLGDGSGLETTNTVTCDLLAGALTAVDGARDWLAVAGRSGTLAGRFRGTPLEGHLAAKTGQLQGVTGLTGFVEGRRELRFAFLARGDFGTEAGRILQDRLAVLLADYPAP